jgi:hypothetical protein
MELIIAGKRQPFMPIKAFRERHGLQDDFSVAYFEAKDTRGMARINDAGEAMNWLEQRLLDAIPAQSNVVSLLMVCDALENAFREALESINDQVGLRAPEVDYAVAGFADVLRRWCYDAIRSHVNSQTIVNFSLIYGDWLTDSIRIASRIFDYVHQGQHWQIQIVNHAYGRVGLLVTIGPERHYVADAIHACPAEGFMYRLLQAITDALSVHLPKS